MFSREMWLFALVIVVCGAISVSATAKDAATEPRTYYVANRGSDAWSGRIPEPNTTRNDGPFATLKRARDEIRKLKEQSGLPTGGVVVQIREGIFDQSETLELT